MQRGAEAELLASYQARLRWTFSLHELEVKKPARETASRMAQEADLIEASIPKGAAVIALDERGKDITSRDLAGRLNDFANRSYPAICFIIGGADGLDTRIRKRADLTLALGKLTWPHMLVRAMIVEQIYRAQSILAGHPYHRD